MSEDRNLSGDRQALRSAESREKIAAERLEVMKRTFAKLPREVRRKMRLAGKRQAGPKSWGDSMREQGS